MSRKVQASAIRRKYALRRDLYQVRSLMQKRSSGGQNAAAASSADEAARAEEMTQLREMVVRQRAEFDNFRKRTQREKDQIRDLAGETVLSKLLSVVDNFERALASAANATDVKPVRDGIQMIFTQLQRVLEAEGLHQVQALNQPFNPNQHDALASEERTDVAENHVCEVLLPGYIYKEKLLRPAMVKVAKSPAGDRVETGG